MFLQFGQEMGWGAFLWDLNHLIHVRCGWHFSEFLFFKYRMFINKECQFPSSDLTDGSSAGLEKCWGYTENQEFLAKAEVHTKLYRCSKFEPCYQMSLVSITLVKVPSLWSFLSWLSSLIIWWPQLTGPEKRMAFLLKLSLKTEPWKKRTETLLITGLKALISPKFVCLVSSLSLPFSFWHLVEN